MKKTEIKKAVRENYARIAGETGSCCGSGSSCCAAVSQSEEISRKIGYSAEEIGSVPQGANLGLGCGNPVALAAIKQGDTVLDLGSGAGFDCFLAARRVGPSGRVIGVDMTPQMLDKARQNAIQGGYGNVEFRLGEIENLPVADNYVDMVISNCVINLSPDKERVFHEALRVLKPGGRLIISDIVLLKDLPVALLNSVAAYVGCVSGAALRQDYLAMVGSAGFRDVEILAEDSFDLDCMLNAPQAQAIITEADLTPDRVKSMASVVRSIKLQAFKPSL